MPPRHAPALLLALILAAPPAILCAGNLLLNPSFETTRLSGLPAGWGLYFPVIPEKNPLGLVRGSASLFGTDHAVAYQGTRSIKISSATPVRCAMSQRELPCAPGQTLRFSVAMKGEDLATSAQQGAWARLSFATSTRGVGAGSPVLLKSTQSTFDWRRFEIEAEAPPGAVSMTVELYLWQSPGTVWFDDVVVERISGPASPGGEIADPHNLARYREANLALGAPAAGERRVVFIGDSITQKWNLDASFPKAGYINRGISGQHSGSILGRIPHDVLGLDPRVAYLMAGINDLTSALSPEIIAANIQEAVRLCGGQGIRVIVASVLPVADRPTDKNPDIKQTSPRSPALIHELNTRLQAICREEPNAAYLDLYSLVVDADDRMNAGFSSDGVHPNAAGYRAMAPAVARAVQAALSASR